MRARSKSMSSMDTETHTEQAPKTAPRKAKKTAASRQPGRPHRRLEDEVLAVRKQVLKKKLALLQAKQTICEERLQSYEDEEQVRAKHAAAP